MLIAIDVGFYATKVRGGAKGKIKTFTFPSITGDYTPGGSSIESDPGLVITSNGATYTVGQTAIDEAWVTNRDKSGYKYPETDIWYTLAMAGITEVTNAASVNVDLITALPIDYTGKEIVKGSMKGAHYVTRLGRTPQTIKIDNVWVAEQGVAAAFSGVFSHSGKPTNPLKGQSVVIDIGSHTTNLAMFQGMKPTMSKSRTIDFGVWDIVEKVRRWIDAHYPELRPEAHEVAEIIKAQEFSYYGNAVKLNGFLDEALAPVAQKIYSATQDLKWKNLPKANNVLVSGGGAHMLYPRIRAYFTHAKMISRPEMANVDGLYKLGLYKQTRQ